LLCVWENPPLPSHIQLSIIFGQKHKGADRHGGTCPPSFRVLFISLLLHVESIQNIKHESVYSSYLFFSTQNQSRTSSLNHSSPRISSQSSPSISSMYQYHLCNDVMTGKYTLHLFFSTQNQCRTSSMNQ